MGWRRDLIVKRRVALIVDSRAVIPAGPDARAPAPTWRLFAPPCECPACNGARPADLRLS
jgi:hypothetical protein